MTTKRPARNKLWIIDLPLNSGSANKRMRHHTTILLQPFSRT